jgi:tetratricopeptide (TPR) repeat protein
MNSPTLVQLRTRWSQFQAQTIGKAPNDKEAVVSGLYELLEQVLEAGTYTSSPAERRDLQELARDVADNIFQQTLRYPAATIKATSENSRASLQSKLVMHNIPLRRNPVFVDRSEELERLRLELEPAKNSPAMQIIVVHGLDGIGKTQLALEYAWKHLQEYAAVFWVRADNPETLNEGLAALAPVLNVPEAATSDRTLKIGAVLSWLGKNRRWLLVVDNADTDEAAVVIQHRLPPNLPGAVLITSRLSRWPVDMPHLALAVFSLEDAVRFLLSRVAKDGHHAGDEAAARSLANDLGSLPLALEQAAAAIIEMRWSFDQYRQRLGNARSELLGERRERTSAYSASVPETWRITIDEVSALARDLLKVAAWFAPDAIPRGIFSADPSIASELGDRVDSSEPFIDRALAELDRFSLIRLTIESVSLHRLLQAVAQDAIGQADSDLWLRRAIQLFNAFAPRVSDDLNTLESWTLLAAHAEILIEHAKGRDIETLAVSAIANNLGRFLKARAVYLQAEAMFRYGLGIEEHRLGSEEPEIAGQLDDLAELLTIVSRLDEAEPLFQRALAIREKVLGPEHPDVAESLNNLAALYDDQVRYSLAVPIYKRALAIWEKSLGPDHPDVAISLNNLAIIYFKQGQYAEAGSLGKRALAIWENALGPNHPNVATGLNNLAELCYEQGKYAEAAPLYRRALEILEKAFGPDHPNVATALNNLAALYYKQGQYAESEPMHRRAQEIWENTLGPDHPDVAASLNNMAMLQFRQGRYSEAEPLYRRALAIWEKGLGSEHPEVAAGLNNLARLYASQGRYDEAEPLCRRALATWEKALGPDHPDVATGLNDLGMLLSSQGLYDEAELTYRRALSIREKALGPDHPDIAESRRVLTELLNR